MGLADRIKSSKPQYLRKPHIGLTKVTGFEESKNNDKYKGKTPYIKFFTVSDGMKSEAQFWLEKDGDSQDKINNKYLRIKRFLMDLGIDVNNTPDDKLFESAIGREFNGAFKQRQYIGKDRDGKPEIKTSVELAWANPKTEPFRNITLEKLTESLSPEYQTKFDAQLEAWNEEHGISNEPIAQMPQGQGEDIDNYDDDDDAPF